MKKLIALCSILFVANSFAYTWIGAASSTCKELAKAKVESILETDLKYVSSLNYIVRGPEANVQLTNDLNELIKVKVSIQIYTLDNDDVELNENYVFSGEYNRAEGECQIVGKPDYKGNYCGLENQLKCIK